MRKAGYSILLVLVIAGAFLAGSWYNQRRAVTSLAPGTRETAAHVDPAHSSHESGTQGMTTDSGMPSGPAQSQGAPGEPGRSPAPLSPGAVNVSADRQQLIGVRVSAVEKASGTRTLRLLGRVAPDEARVYRINAGIEGFIRDVSAPTTGSRVKKNQALATFFAPNSIQVVQQYILVLGATDRVKKAAGEGSPEVQMGPLANSNYQQRVAQLRNMGMSALQMEEIERTRQVPESITIVAPADGFVLARNVSPDLRFDRGAELYRIADLSRVWILVDAFEDDAQYLRPGVRAEVSLPTQRKAFGARVAEILPQFDAATRTLKVRLEADNPGYVLRPDMFVDVALPVTLPSTIAVPVDAVLDSGLKKTVFVERGEGVFEPRQVETGWRFGDRVEVVKGLTLGERIVTAGAFLLDSESRMKPSAAGGGAGTTAPGASRDGGATAAHPKGGQDQPAHGHSGH